MFPFRLVLALALLGACAPLPAEPAAPTPQPQSQATPFGDAGGRKTIAIVFASWCGHCRNELAELGALHERADLRIVGVNFRWQEEYDERGDSAAVRDFVAAEAPWLDVLVGDDALFARLGSPPKVPTLYVYDRTGQLVAVYDRRAGPMPDRYALAELLDAL